MRTWGYLKSGEAVVGNNSYVSAEHLMNALRQVDSRGNNSIHLSDIKIFDEEGKPILGRPLVVKLKEDDMILFRQRLRGEDFYPFVERDEKSDIISIHLEKKESLGNVYFLKFAGWGPFYESASDDPFWNTHAFLIGVAPHREKPM